MTIDKNNQIHFKFDFIKKAWQSIVDPKKYPIQKLNKKAKQLYDDIISSGCETEIQRVKDIYNLYPEYFV